MFTNLNEAKISSRKQGRSPTINGLYYAIQTTWNNKIKRKKYTSANFVYTSFKSSNANSKKIVDAFKRW